MSTEGIGPKIFIRQDEIWRAEDEVNESDRQKVINLIWPGLRENKELTFVRVTVYDDQADVVTNLDNTTIISTDICQKLLKIREGPTEHTYSKGPVNPPQSSVIANIFKCIWYNLFSTVKTEKGLYPKVRTRLVSEETPETGNVLIETYGLPDGTKGTETVTRANTLEEYKKLLEALPDSEKKAARLEKLQKKLDNRKTWVKSKDFRALCKKQGVGFLKACATFNRGLPVNLRIQEMKAGEDVVARVGRLGAITDVTNGWYSLSDLEEMKADLEGGNTDWIDTHSTNIQSYLNNPPPVSPGEKIRKKLLGQKPKLNQDQIVSALKAQREIVQAKYLEHNKKGSGVDALQNIIDERREVLQHQMLLYLMEQLKANEELLKKEKPFNLYHLSLLNLHKRELDRSGWMHDEGIAFQDFAQIMKEFNDMKIVFGEEGPRVDVEGKKIYLPSESFETDVNTIRLQTYIFNIAVQGNTKNDDLQYEHNEKMLQELYIPEKIRKRMDDKYHNSGYDLAEDLAMFLHERAFTEGRGALGINCASGKDRTGFVCARLMQKNLNKENNPFLRVLWNKMAIAIANENDATRTLKIDPREYFGGKLRDYESLTTLPGRVYYLAMQLFAKPSV